MKITKVLNILTFVLNAPKIMNVQHEIILLLDDVHQGVSCSR